jgi:hypothetical protein
MYRLKTGYRPAPTLIHPSLGVVVCHQLPDRLEIPRHVSILTGTWPAWGGYLGLRRSHAGRLGQPREQPPDPSRPRASIAVGQ